MDEGGWTSLNGQSVPLCYIYSYLVTIPNSTQHTRPCVMCPENTFMAQNAHCISKYYVRTKFNKELTAQHERLHT